LKVFIQQLFSGLYWKTGSGWVRRQEEAEVFDSSNKAIILCIQREMRDVRIVLNFGDPKYDAVLHPFGLRGNQPTSGELVDRSRETKERARTLRERAKALLAGAQQSIAVMKEIKKRTPFKRKKPGEQ
jgi:hypothetical protein